MGAASGIAASLVVNLAIGLVVAPLAALSVLIHLTATVGAGYVAGRFAVHGPRRSTAGSPV